MRSPSLRPVGPASFLRFLLGESRLLLRGHAWWWYTLLAGANLAALLVPAESVSWTLLVAWLIPIAAWSSLGCRERLRGTEALLFSTSGPRLRQLPVQWAAGTILSLATAVGPLIRLAATGDLPSLLTLGVGAAFVPALALCLGTWSGSRKLFEALYLALWYVGPLNEVPALDYMGVTGIALETGATSAFAAATLLLFALAWIGRGRRLQAD